MRTRSEPSFVSLATLAIAVMHLAGALPAQNQRLSPPDAATVSGSGNTYPFYFASQRYQQVHADVRGSTIVITEIAFRRTSASTTYATAVARTIDAELNIGTGDYATSTNTFAANYTSPPQVAVTRKMINLPDLTAPTSTPEPFNVRFPFDTPYIYTGNSDLVWDLLIHSNTSTGAYFCDARQAVGNASLQNLGTGCVATGQTNTMLQQATIRTLPAPQNLLDFNPRIFYGPQSATCVILMGTQAVNLPLPGLCANLQLLNVAISFPGTTSANANGTFPVSFSVPFQPNYVGLQLTFQGAALDAGQPGLGVAVTNGVTATLAAPPPYAPVRRIWGAVNGTSGSTDTGSVNIPYGLVTKFGHL